MTVTWLIWTDIKFALATLVVNQHGRTWATVLYFDVELFINSNIVWLSIGSAVPFPSFR